MYTDLYYRLNKLNGLIITEIFISLFFVQGFENVIYVKNHLFRIIIIIHNYPKNRLMVLEQYLKNIVLFFIWYAVCAMSPRLLNFDSINLSDKFHCQKCCLFFVGVVIYVHELYMNYKRINNTRDKTQTKSVRKRMLSQIIILLRSNHMYLCHHTLRKMIITYCNRCCWKDCSKCNKNDRF